MNTLPYQHILFATDLSETSHKVAARASAIANTCQAKLSIVHVITHSTMAYAGEFTIPIEPEVEAAITNQAKTHLAQLGEKYKIPENRQHLKEGSVKTSVISLSETLKADLIVIGSHEQTGLSALLGSQANAILHAAKCDVWVIHN